MFLFFYYEDSNLSRLLYMLFGTLELNSIPRVKSILVFGTPFAGIHGIQIIRNGQKQIRGETVWFATVIPNQKYYSKTTPLSFFSKTLQLLFTNTFYSATKPLVFWVKKLPKRWKSKAIKLNMNKACIHTQIKYCFTLILPLPTEPYLDFQLCTLNRNIAMVNESMKMVRGGG